MRTHQMMMETADMHTLNVIEATATDMEDVTATVDEETCAHPRSQRSGVPAMKTCLPVLERTEANPELHT